MHLLMPRDARVEAFLDNDQERLVQRIGHVDGRGVMVEAATAATDVILAQHRHIEIPGLHLGLARIHAGQRAFAEADGRQAGRAAQALLGAAIDGVDTPVIHAYLMPAETGHHVHYEQRIMFVDNISEAGERLMSASAGLGMDDAQQPGLRVAVERGADLCEGEDVAPRCFDDMDLGAATIHHVLHPGAEDAVDADDDFIARLDQVAGDAFHAGHAGAANGEGERVFGAEDLAQQFAGLVHDGDILGVKVADRGRGHSAQDALGDRTWAGSHEDAFGGICCGGTRSIQKHRSGYRRPAAKASRFGSGIDRTRATDGSESVWRACGESGAMVLRACCSLVHPLSIPCTTLVQPLYNPYTWIVLPLSRPSVPIGTLAAPRSFNRARA